VLSRRLGLRRRKSSTRSPHVGVIAAPAETNRRSGVWAARRGSCVCTLGVWGSVSIKVILYYTESTDNNGLAERVRFRPGCQPDAPDAPCFARLRFRSFRWASAH